MERLASNPLVIIFGWMTITFVVATVGYYWHSSHRNDLDASLKHEMLQRGFSADEIVQVINAAKPKFVKVPAAPQPRFRAAVPLSD